MAGRPKIFDETEVLDKAVALFWQKGYSNVSTDELCTAMGIGKGSLYLAFKGGKKEIFEKSMKRVVETNFPQLRRNIETCDNPITLIKDFFLALIGQPFKHAEYGCYFGNALLQTNVDDSELRKLAVQNLHTLESIFHDAMKRGKDMGLLKTNLSPTILAAHLINLWNGINITKKLDQNKDELKQLIKINLDIIQ
jgi:TetR/AcrR family transcriptional repressor of nem operon